MPPKLIRFSPYESPSRLDPGVRRVVIAEGKTTGEVVRFLLGDARHADEFIVIDGGSVEELRSSVIGVASRLRERLLKAVAIVRDAEQKPARDAAKSLAQTLAETEWPTKAHRESRAEWLTPGTVIAGERAERLGVFIFPDNNGEGMIESLLLTSLKDQQRACIDEYLECMDASPRHPDKARCLAFLAATAEKKHHDNIGDALRAGRFDLQHQCFDPLRHFLRELDQ